MTVSARSLLLAAVLSFAAVGAFAAEYPKPVEADWTAADFHFRSGEVAPALHLHYTTVGDPSGEPVLILHGTAGSGDSMLTAAFAGDLFGPGQPLDARKYYIILPDSIGAGRSARPSEGLRAAFPHYDYADVVQAQYRLVTEGLGLHHLRLVLGNSMGGMQAWMWGTTYPDFMDALVPMASQPTPMAARNWMMRRMLIESIRQDPAYHGGDYTTQPASLRLANVMFGIATAGGTLGYQAMAPSHALADKAVDARLTGPPPDDANDFIWQWDSSRDFDVSGDLGRIRAPVLAINSADDERNPPETGLMAAAMARLPHATMLLIPASAETRGHGTTAIARFYAKNLADFLAAVPEPVVSAPVAPVSRAAAHPG